MCLQSGRAGPWVGAVAKPHATGPGAEKTPGGEGVLRRSAHSLSVAPRVSLTRRAPESGLRGAPELGVSQTRNLGPDPGQVTPSPEAQLRHRGIYRQSAWCAQGKLRCAAMGQAGRRLAQGALRLDKRASN